MTLYAQWKTVSGGDGSGTGFGEDDTTPTIPVKEVADNSNPSSIATDKSTLARTSDPLQVGGLVLVAITSRVLILGARRLKRLR